VHEAARATQLDANIAKRDKQAPSCVCVGRGDITQPQDESYTHFKRVRLLAVAVAQSKEGGKQMLWLL